MKKLFSIIVLVGLMASLNACTIMKFDGTMSQAKSLEMSNVRNMKGEDFKNADFDTRSFYLLGLLPLKEKSLGEAIGPYNKAADLEIYSKYDAVDVAIAYVPALLGLPAVVQSRGYTIEGTRK